MMSRAVVCRASEEEKREALREGKPGKTLALRASGTTDDCTYDCRGQQAGRR